MEIPYVGAGGGTPNEIIQLAGGKNIFADVEGNWASISWEEVIARNPEVIVLVDADWTSAEDKKNMLKTDPRFSDLTAVKHNKFVTIDFVYTTEGVRNAEAVSIIAKGLYPEKFNK
jgi:iron complex transport system substrate-binding protein